MWVARITTVFVLVLSLGWHWALLQTVAWTGMIVAYSQTDSFRQAVSKTFDGKHPCPMCKSIQKGRAEEQQKKHHQVNPDSKLDLAVVWQVATFDFTAVHQLVPLTSAAALARAEAPPRPPPRA